ncbi:type II secretion system protein [Lusitaniella coriacea LEGE 07157]|uniref:Type II secretion system protein n=1 Tax=Lusitaniella coriacea LEGE 07157 TaxID=945747 RepID=A0A8J7B6J5_9CYAN|nr:hormogonium polysaccharide secretion pseudopilin HpsB [Lusitaniella coriacea]MBE9114469.1 type II secretion system protein [Lusitaniella coriacea LEGE 07157]
MNPHKIFKHLQSQSDESGLTIIESLVAIIVVSIMLVSIAPVLTLSVANRLQAKQTEAATKAAQAYIDGIRSGTIDHPPVMRKGDDTLGKYNAPQTGNLTCNDANKKEYCTAPANNLFCIDGDGEDVKNAGDKYKCTKDSHRDMIVQGFGYVPDPDRSKGYRSYKLGVRVYRADAFALSGKLLKHSDTGVEGKKQSSFGYFKKKTPLLETTSEIEVDDSSEFDKLCKKAGFQNCF